MPYIIDRDRGFFREEGLEPDLIFMKAAQTIPALLAGGVDFGTATGTGIAAAVSGVDVRLIFALTDRPSFDLIAVPSRSEEHTSELQSLRHLVCRLLLEKKKRNTNNATVIIT